MRKCKPKRPARFKTKLGLPDLEQAKTAVLASLRSPESQRSYRHSIEEFVFWYCSEPRLSFNKTVVTRYRIHLEGRQLAAVRRLAYEAADTGILSPELAAGIRRVKGSKKLGMRLGNWLTVNEARTLWQLPDAQTLKGKRDRAMLAVLLGCGLRRRELIDLTTEHLQRREDHWAIVDLVGKGGHIQTVPVPDWVKCRIDDWLKASGVSHGRLFRRVCRMGMVWGAELTEKVFGMSLSNTPHRWESRSSHRTICGALALGSVTALAASWSRYSFCWDMCPCRQPRNIWAANSDSEKQ